MADVKHVVAVASFYDEEAKVARTVGDEFDMTAERIAQVNGRAIEHHYKRFVEVVAQKPADAPKKAKKGSKK